MGGLLSGEKTPHTRRRNEGGHPLSPCWDDDAGGEHSYFSTRKTSELIAKVPKKSLPAKALGMWRIRRGGEGVRIDLLELRMRSMGVSRRKVKNKRRKRKQTDEYLGRKSKESMFRRRREGQRSAKGKVFFKGEAKRHPSYPEKIGRLGTRAMRAYNISPTIV